MNTLSVINERLATIGLSNDPKYQFLCGPVGLPIEVEEKIELERVGQTAAAFIRRVRAWYDEETRKKGGSRMGAMLESGVPRDYLALSATGTLPITMMVDTVWTKHGWRIVEIDVTNRNAMGYPLIMRHIYDLPSVWRGIDQAWRETGWSGVTQIMADQYRFYEPYFRFFLQQLEGELITEAELTKWLKERNKDDEVKFLDLPILYHSKDAMPELLSLARPGTMAIPPIHVLSSKTVLALPWEIQEFEQDAIKEFVSETRFISRAFTPPDKEFFVKLLQSGGAHGTFQNNREKLEHFLKERRPQAIWQEALPLAQREVTHFTPGGQLVTDDRYVRVSLFITQDGEVIDADATASLDTIVHGGKQCVMTVPVLK